MLQTTRSPELSGVQPEQVLGISAVAPPGTDSVRAAISAQNRFGLLMPAHVLVKQPRLASLGRASFDDLTIQTPSPMPRVEGPRNTVITLQARVPDGAVVNLQSSRGWIPTSAVFAGGTALATLRYGDMEAGAATVNAVLAARKVTTIAPDPHAAAISFTSFQRDGSPSAALVRLSRNGVVLRGRYDGYPDSF